MPNTSALELWLAQLGKPKLTNKGTAAPGTNSRVDVDTPDQIGTLPDSGKGHPDWLGYAQHGDAPRSPTPADAAAIRAATARRFPALTNLGKPGPVLPEFNQFYGPWRSLEWDKVAANSAHGTLAPGVTNSAVVTLDSPANLRTSMYPGAIQVFPVLHVWAFSQSILTATGQYSFTWNLPGLDFQYPLGEYNANVGGDIRDNRAFIIPAPLVDPGIATLGTITVTPTGLVGAPTINWRMLIGWAYMLPTPAFRGAVPMRVAGSQAEAESILEHEA